MFGKTGTVINGKEVLYTEARFPVSVDEVKSGKAPSAKFKAKNGYTGKQAEASAPSADPWQTVDSDEDGLPFNL